MFHWRINAIIGKISEKYRQNNLFLEDARSSENKDSAAFRLSYFKCGSPFFKDALGCTAPFNEDYKRRKTISNEFFPFDIPSDQTRWKTKEKVALINGVKNQMINYIKSQQSQKLCQETKTRAKIQKLKFIANSFDLNESSMLDIFNSIENDYADYKTNWNIISFNDLKSKHSVSEAMGMWYSYLRPDLNREPFSEEENETLVQVYQENAYRDWNDIASKLNQRSALQVFVYFHSTYSRLCIPKARWTDKEDADLLQNIDKYSVQGVINWGKIGQLMPLRSKTQCYNRYQVIFNGQGCKKGQFQKKEIRLIIDFVAKYGENFHQMPKDFLPGRSIIQIKNHYNNALKHKGKVNQWSRDEDKRLMEFVTEHGTNAWKKISLILTTHSRISCRTRYLTISKYLKKHPNSRIEDVPCRIKPSTSMQKMNLSSESEDDDEDPERTQTLEKYRKHNPDMVKLMATTFNCDFADREIKIDDGRLLVLLALYNMNQIPPIEKRSFLLTRNQMDKMREIYNYRINAKLMAEIKFINDNTNFLMPPNYSTAVGLRAISIKFHEELEDTSPMIIAKPTAAYETALKNFQQFYFSLFYWSSMLLKVDSAELTDFHFVKFPPANPIEVMQTNRLLTLKRGAVSKEPPSGSLAKKLKTE